MFTKSVLALVALTAATPVLAGPGADQMARGLGVEPGVYSLSQLMTLERAYQENDRNTVDFILSQGNGVSSRAASTVDAVATGTENPGKVQLAKILGVNPADYTLAQLVALDAQRND